MRATMTLFTICLLTAFGGAALAQTPAGIVPPLENSCDEENGAGFGLCNAYCHAMDCHLDRDPNNPPNPSASEAACAKVKANYLKHTGKADLVCDLIVECPCLTEPWGNVGEGIWAKFAAGDFEPTDTCIDDNGATTLNELSDDGSVDFGASASEAGGCSAREVATIYLGPALDAAEATVCRDLLRAKATGLPPCAP